MTPVAQNRAALTTAANNFRAAQPAAVDPKLVRRIAGLRFTGGTDDTGEIVGDVAVPTGTRLIVQSPDLTWHTVTVANNGAITTAAVTTV